MASPQPIQTKSINTSSAQRRPSTFLELSPIDYSSSSLPSKVIPALGSPEQKAAAEAAAEMKNRRSSSSASDSSAKFLGQGRFLKLGGGEGDWSEHVLE